MRNVILKRYDEIDYVLIARIRDNDTVHEYVAAWSYNENGSWGQGHYFPNIEDAIDYIHKKQKNEVIYNLKIKKDFEKRLKQLEDVVYGRDQI